MIHYVIRRLLLTILVIVCAAFIIFTIMFFIPGDPAEILMGIGSTPAEVEKKRAELGLDQPYIVQLGRFMYDSFLRFDLGTSWFRGVSVMSGLLGRFPRTFMLGILTVIVVIAGGVPLGVNAAIHRGGWQDRLLMTSSMFFISIPEFWLALMLIIVFSLKLNLLPSFGIESWLCYVLPVVSGSFGGICNVARQTRSSVLEVVSSDYITTARAKGMKEHAVIYKHMLPNALIPVITIAGNYLTRCVGGTIVLEKIFSFPGLGLYMTDAISQRDYPIIRGGVVLMAAFTAILMLIIDLAYAYADPRIKAQYAQAAKIKGDKAMRHTYQRKPREPHTGDNPGHHKHPGRRERNK